MTARVERAGRSRTDATGPMTAATRTRGGRGRDEAPMVLRRYRLRRRLGTGGFATVWLATDERLDREVAIKILPRERVVGGRFEREARAAARLAHPGIVTLFEAAVDDEGAYLVSELVHGSTLDRLLGEGRLSDRDVVQIGIALCDALMHAHAHGVIHRDVKPSNVLIPERPTSPAGLARLTDFGVARVLGGDSLTLTGDVIGTAAYMAPEQAQGLPAGAPADLFSLALVLYEALTGVNPVRRRPDQPARRLGMHLPPLRRQRRELPRELGQAIDLALRPRPRRAGAARGAAGRVDGGRSAGSPTSRAWSPSRGARRRRSAARETGRGPDGAPLPARGSPADRRSRAPQAVARPEVRRPSRRATPHESGGAPAPDAKRFPFPGPAARSPASPPPRSEPGSRTTRRAPRCSPRR